MYYVGVVGDNRPAAVKGRKKKRMAWHLASRSLSSTALRSGAKPASRRIDQPRSPASCEPIAECGEINHLYALARPWNWDGGWRPLSIYRSVHHIAKADDLQATYRLQPAPSRWEMPYAL